MAAWHTIQQGECVLSLSLARGFADWRVVWDHADNAPLRAERDDPAELMAGDRVFVPDPRPRDAQSATGRYHSFELALPKLKLRIALHDVAGNAVADKAYRLEVAGAKYEGRTTSAGLIEHDLPEPTAGAADLWVWLHDPPAPEPADPPPANDPMMQAPDHEEDVSLSPDDDPPPDDAAASDDDDEDEQARRDRHAYRVVVRLGHLAPYDEVLGAQQRLGNLGFQCPTSGRLDEPTRAALRAFQRARGIDESGDLDAATRDRLRADHTPA